MRVDRRQQQLSIGETSESTQPLQPLGARAAHVATWLDKVHHLRQYISRL